MFGPAAEMLNIHSTFENNLIDRKAAWYPGQPIGDLFVSDVTPFKFFSSQKELFSRNAFRISRWISLVVEPASSFQEHSKLSSLPRG